VKEEPLAMKIVDAYFFIRAITCFIGVMLYYGNLFYYTRYGILSYVGFMFEDLQMFAISPLIPLIHAIAFAVCFIGLRKDIGIVRLLAIILLFIDLFAFPVGTVISLALIIYLALPSTARFFTPIAKETSTYRLIGASILIFAFVGFYATSGISQTLIPMSEEPNLMLSAIDKIDTNIDINDTGNVPVVIEMYYTSNIMQAVEMQGVVMQNIELMGGDITGTTTKVLNSIVADVPADNLEEIASNPNVKRIIKDEPVIQLWGFIDEQDRGTQNSYIWYPSKKVWQYNTTATGKGIVVAIVDSGINSEMRWLQRNGKSVVIDSYQLYGEYVHWHGTAVASVIASQNSEIKGVAPDVDLLNVEVFLPSGQATYSDIIKGWEWVVDWKESHPDRYVICSNSLGVPSAFPSILDTACDNMVLRYNIPMVVASGNLNPQYKICSPGMGRYALTVGAVDWDGTIASFSCRGPIAGMKKPDVCALGVNVPTFDPNGIFITPSGTSFSAPLVSGLLALIVEDNPGYDAIQLYDAVRNGAIDGGNAGFDSDYGYGVADYQGAIASLDEQKPSREYVYLFALLPIVALIVMFYPEIDKRLAFY
jgi:subtilisin family serine protease